MFHIVGLYPHDNKILRKYAESSRPLSGVASQCSAKEMPKGVGMSDRTSNPFAFSSLASLLAAQGGQRVKYLMFHFSKSRLFC